MRMSILKLLLLMLMLVLATVSPMTAAAEQDECIEPFVDGFFEKALTEDMPGAVFTAVQDGEVIINKGYGYANFEKQQAVDPNETLFRVGSISKLLITTAVMQLTEEGKLDLQRDVSAYLGDFPKVGDGVTLDKLLTHTAGFEEKFIGMEVEDYHEVVPLKAYLRENMPEQVRKPGEYMAYSNHGMTLAALVASEVSGQTYDEVVRERIFTPLGMEDSFTRMMDAPVDRVAREYVKKDGKEKELSLYDFNVGPAGAVLSTGADMAKFIAFQLNGDPQVLSDKWLGVMHEQHFTQHPDVEGMAYGFFEILHGEDRFLVHGGDTNGTHSFLFLDPARNFGFFTSNNSEVGSELNDQFVSAFLETFYPVAKQAVGSTSSQSFKTDLSALSGDYRMLRYSETGLDRISLFFTPPIVVEETGDDQLTIMMGKRQDVFTRVGDLTFQHDRDGRIIRFEDPEQTDREHVFINSWVIEKISLWESPEIHFFVMFVAVLMFLAGVIFLLIVPFVRRLRGRVMVESSQQTWMRWTTSAISILSLAFLLGTYLVVNAMDNVNEIAYGIPIGLQIVRIFPLVTIVLLIALGVQLIGIWRKEPDKRLRYVFVSSIFVAGICFELVLSYYRILPVPF